ncbi:MAG: PAS domain-containing protein [Balneolaceae bacterium]
MDIEDYQEIFTQSSALKVAVDTDYNVLDASEGFLNVTHNERDGIIGKYIFDIFPEISDQDISVIFINTMRDSINQAVKEKTTHTSPVVRYQVPSHKPDNGEGIRYWKAINTPILDDDKNVTFISQRYIDVTDSRELSEQLEVEKKNLDEYKTAAEYIENALKQAPAPICILRGPEHIFELVNKKFLRIVPGKDIIGKSARQAMPELKGQGFFKILDDVYTTEKNYVGSEVPATFNVGRGKEVDAYVDFVYQILYDTDGEKSGIFVLGVDVTDQVNARKKAEESEYRYRTLIEESTVATALYKGPDIILQYANDKMLNFWDKDKHVFGQPLHEILPEIEDQPFLDYLYKVYESGKTYTGIEEKAFLNNDGELTPYFFNFTYKALRDSDGEIYGILHIAIDVTEQVQAKRAIEKNQETLNQLLNSMPQKISHTDKKGSVVFFNQQWMEETGYSLEELQSNGWLKTLHPDDFPALKKKWVNAVKTGIVFEVETRIYHKDLGYRWNLNRAVPVTNDEGDILMWVGSNTDIHERKRHEETLEKAVRERTKELEQAYKDLLVQNEEKEKQKKELEIANKELESFAYISSHDLQEPLRKIQIFIGRIVEKEHLSERGDYYFDRIRDAADRMRNLIEDLLYFSRVNNADKVFETIDLNVIIEEVKEDLKEEIKEKNATVEVGEICEIYVIMFQFRQLMKNLFSNALKFTRPDVSPHISIHSVIKKGSKLDAEKLDPDKKYCHIIFKDNGIGFEAEYNERIFDVFQRLHSREEFKGTGIGLAIVKKIVDNHNGFIFASSKPDEGAQFDIYLPVEHKNSN